MPVTRTLTLVAEVSEVRRHFQTSTSLAPAVAVGHGHAGVEVLVGRRLRVGDQAQHADLPCAKIFGKGIDTLRGAAEPRFDHTPPPRWSNSSSEPTEVRSQGTDRLPATLVTVSFGAAASAVGRSRSRASTRDGRSAVARTARGRRRSMADSRFGRPPRRVSMTRGAGKHAAKRGFMARPTGLALRSPTASAAGPPASRLSPGPVRLRVDAARSAARSWIDPGVAAPTPGWSTGVDSWVTDLTTDQRLARRPFLRWQDGAGAQDAIVVDPTRRYQTMTGFGASMTDSSAYVLSKLPAKARRSIMTELFSTSDGIGLSMLRQPMGASDFAVGQAYSYDDQPAGKTDRDLSDFSIAHDRASSAAAAGGVRSTRTSRSWPARGARRAG